MWVFTILLILAGGGLFYASLNARRKLNAIADVDTSTIADLQQLHGGVAKEIGPGSFEQVVEIKGVMGCDQPLESEIAKTPCAYYAMRVSREWEETYSEYNSQTQRDERKTRRGSDIMAQNTRMVPFWVRDQTGEMGVHPAGAEIEGEQVIDQFHPEGSEARGGTVTFGGFSFQVRMSEISGDRRTLGYRFQESILPLGRNVYVLGVASDSSGELTLQHPREQGQRFIISVRSEEELIASSRSSMIGLQIGAIVCVGLGLLLLVATRVV
jgi:E3 Ubiquitin ligase